jgi:signal transduction histidine kinase
VVSVSGQALFDDLGRFTGYCGSGRDITKETQQRHDLEDARSQAEFASKAKSDFLANMSHELRTPLNAILGFSEVLKLEMMGPHKVPVYKEYAADIHASASLLLEMVNDVLDMAKIESGNLELDIAPCNLGVVVADAVGILKNRARDMGIELRVDVKSALQTAHVDARAIKQVLLNLLSNALKFTEPGGHITVTLEFVQMLGHVIVVKDTGAGIPPDELAKVMEPFYQAKKGAQAAGKGTGLGLALSKALVEAHGGSFHLESTLGRGTAAKVVLPTAVSGTQFEQASAADE